MQSNYDVIVAGGGSAGIGAAIGASKAGAKTLLVEKYGFLGGCAASALVLSYCGLFNQGADPIKAVGGAADIVQQALRDLGCDAKPYCSPTSKNWITLFDPESLKLALDRVLVEHNVDVLLHSSVTDVNRNGAQIEDVTLHGMGGMRRVKANAFVDATGDAFLAMHAGVECRLGNGHGLIQAATAPIRVGGVEADIEIDRNAIVAAFEVYNKTGKYPSARHHAGIYTRIPKSHDMWWMMIDLPLEDLSSETFTKMEQYQRAAANDYVNVLRDGVPGFESAYLIQTPSQVGIRESRHALARYELTEQDILDGRQRPDGIARAAWPLENHSVIGRPTFESIGGDGYAHIPLDSLRADGIDNLYYAGRAIGADSNAFASIRVMGTAFATGEAAGVAAAIGPDVEKVKAMIIANGGII